MSNWDVFQGETLELQRGLSTLQVQAALAAGELQEDDLARPAGTSKPWLPISQIGELTAPYSSLAEPPPSVSPALETPPPSLPDLPSEPDLASPTTSLPTWSESEIEPVDVSFPALPDLPSAGESPISLRPASPQVEEESNQFRLTPTESSQHIPTRQTWGWDENDDDEDDIPAPEVEPAVDPPGGPSSPFLGTPANPAEQWDLGAYDLDSNLGEDSSSRIAVPVPLDPSSLVALPVISERSSQLALSVVGSREWNTASIVQNEEAESEEEQPFTFARRSANKIEELDLAPMVDVAFQLVLFFMVTATTVLYKTLEVPKPSGESPPGALAQGKAKSVDDLRDDFIVVEVDPSGAFKIDREPVVADMDTLVERLRTARDKTARLTMLLSTDFATPHRFAVLAIDAANEIGLRIAVARPQGRQAQASAPALFPVRPTRPPQTNGGDKGA